MRKLKSYILNRFARQSSNYSSWLAECPIDCEVVDQYAPDWQVPADAGIIVTHMHYRWEEISALRRIYETTQVPILVLADGALEYRNTWENPTVADGSVFQPLIGHKLACIGPAQARIVSSWGNEGKCEVVGLPRLDSVVSAEYLPVRKQGPFRILVATANTPAFTPEQREKVIASLSLIRRRFSMDDAVNGRRVDITWRLTDGLEKEVGVAVSDEAPHQRIPLSDAIELADAVITTPSTLYLESVLKRRPTAILDFNNAPTYTPSAWTISAPAHFNQVVRELESPGPSKLHFQHACLHDQLQLRVPARPRLYQLIETMVNAGISARQNGTPICLPRNILSQSVENETSSVPEFDAISLYPENPVFQTNEISRLQLELNQAIARLEQLPKDLDKKDQDIAQKNAHIDEMATQMAELLAKRKTDINKKNQHIESLVELFEKANERVKRLRDQYNEQASVMNELKRQLKANAESQRGDSTQTRAA